MGLRPLPPGEPAVIRPWYPHLLPEDTGVWTAWLQRHPGEARLVWYDLHVGEAVAVPAGMDPRMEAVSNGVTRKRIDVVILTGTTYYVCEIKPLGGHAALGQALMYHRLWVEEFGGGQHAVPGVICLAMDPDVRGDFERFGVRVWEVGDGGG